MTNKKIILYDGTEWYVVAETTYDNNDYLLVCGVEDVEQIHVLNYIKNEQKALFKVITDSTILEAVCPILEEQLKEE